jgi:hypothetical protein
MEIKVVKPRWQKLDDVPKLIVEWVSFIANKTVSINDVNETVSTFEDWLDHTKS